MIDLSCFDWVQLIKKSDLPPNAKYLGLYLGTFMNHDNDVAWPSMKRITHETGLTTPTARKWLDHLDEKGWLIKKRNARQVFNPIGGNQMQNEYLANIPEDILGRVNDLLPRLQGGETVDLRGVNDFPKGGKQFTPNNNRITKNNKPTLEDIRNYVKERGSSVDPQKFYDYFDAGGWVDSKGNKVRNWKQKLITWEKHSPKEQSYGKGGI